MMVEFLYYDVLGPKDKKCKAFLAVHLCVLVLRPNTGSRMDQRIKFPPAAALPQQLAVQNLSSFLWLQYIGHNKTKTTNGAGVLRFGPQKSQIACR